ncbi:MAG: hypothetical protein ACM34K_01045 [Bacillota bacterium]
MKITSNTVGNYGPGYLNQVKQASQVKQTPQVSQTTKAAQTSQVNTTSNIKTAVQINSKPAVSQAAQTSAASAEGISNDEKNFFINLYPENKGEIVDYHFYQKTGKMSGVAVGSLFDRRG